MKKDIFYLTIIALLSVALYASYLIAGFINQSSMAYHASSNMLDLEFAEINKTKSFHFLSAIGLKTDLVMIGENRGLKVKNMDFSYLCNTHIVKEKSEKVIAMIEKYGTLKSDNNLTKTKLENENLKRSLEILKKECPMQEENVFLEKILLLTLWHQRL